MSRAHATKRDIARLEVQQLRSEVASLRAALAGGQPEKRRFSAATVGLIATLAAAIFGLFGTVIGAYLERQSSLDLERKRFEFELVRQGLTLQDDSTRAHYLRFITDVGFVTDPGLRAALNDPSLLPVLPGRDGGGGLSRGGDGGLLCPTGDCDPTNPPP